MELSWSVGPQSVAAFILFIGVLIFVHELGHFLAAKFFGITVLKFSLGFGPSLISFRRNGTDYQIAAIPLGGFVRMAGDSPEAQDEVGEGQKGYLDAPLHQRAVVSFAGPAFNLLFPVLCFFAYDLSGPEVLAPVVGQVEPERPGALAGIKPGDRVLDVEGHRVYSFSRLSELISERPNQAVAMRVARGDDVLDLTVTPAASPSRSLFGKPIERGLISVSWSQEGSRVGVAFPDKNVLGLKTGDRVLSVNDQPVNLATELLAALKAHPGETVQLKVLRPAPRQASALLWAESPVEIILSQTLPNKIHELEDLGLAPSGSFIRSVIPGGAADRGGLKPGDQVLSAGGKPVRLFWAFMLEVQDRHPGKPVEVVVRRDGKPVHLTLQAEAVSCEHPVTKKAHQSFDVGLGAGALPPGDLHCEDLAYRANSMPAWTSLEQPIVEEAQLSVWEAFTAALRETLDVAGLIIQGIFMMFSGDASLKNVGGPLSLFKVAAQAAELGLGVYVRMMAVISVNLGLINLLPIPVFDGGNLMLVGVEAIRRRPLSPEARERVALVGLVFIIALFVLAFGNDIQQMGWF